jgi:type IV secretory pathway VirB2 component (pilin)
VKRVVLTLLLVVVVAVGIAPKAGAETHRVDGEVRRVLVVSYPTTTWQLVRETKPKNLLSLLHGGAVGSMSLRTIGPSTSLGEAYVSMSAGNRAGVEDTIAGLALPPTAAYEGDTVEQVFERRCGCRSNGATVLHVGMPRVVRQNDRYLYGAEPGALADALRTAGHRTAVVANADEEFGTVGDGVHREAALAMVDHEGRVPFGVVGPTLVRKDPAAPFGVRMDEDAAAAAVHASLGKADVVLLEMSDLSRADAYSMVASTKAVADERAAAMGRADALLGRVLSDVDLRRDLVIVVGPTGPRGVAELGIAGMAGVGIEPGRLRSPTTRRAGFVSLPDVAPTILEAFDVELPNSMAGTPMTAVAGSAPDDATFRALQYDDVVARFRDKATGPISATFVIFQVVVYGLAAMALVRWRRMRRWIGFLALITLAQPSLAFASRLVPYQDLGVPVYVLVFFLLGAILAAGAEAVGRVAERRLGPGGPMVAPLLLVGLTLVTLLVDVVVGSPLQINTVFGYSPTIAGRFAGWGNLAFALAASAAIVVATGLWGLGVLERGRRYTVAAALVLGVVVAADGLPSLGSDVGGVLALFPASAVVVLLLSGRRVGWRKAVLIGVGTIAAISAFALVDLSRPVEDRTHLGRLAAKVFDADGGGLATTLGRKLNANISILTSSIWTWVIPFAIAFFAFLVWKRMGLLRALEERIPGLRACLVGSLVAGFLGFALNDSGVAVPAMMLAVVLPYVTYLVVRTTTT